MCHLWIYRKYYRVGCRFWSTVFYRKERQRIAHVQRHLLQRHNASTSKGGYACMRYEIWVFETILRTNWLYLNSCVEIINAGSVNCQSVQPNTKYYLIYSLKVFHIDREYSVFVMLKYRNTILQRDTLLWLKRQDLNTIISMINRRRIESH